MPEHLDPVTARALVTEAAGRPLRRAEARKLAKMLRRVTNFLPSDSNPTAVLDESIDSPCPPSRGYPQVVRSCPNLSWTRLDPSVYTQTHDRRTEGSPSDHLHPSFDRPASRERAGTDRPARPGDRRCRRARLDHRA